MKSRPLRWRVLWWLAIYVVLLSGALVVSGYIVHEHAERVVWQELLETELERIEDRNAHDPGYRWENSDTLSLHSLNEQALPELRGLAPGLHDDMVVAGRKSAILVRDTASLGRVALVLDITDFDELERFVSRWAVIAALIISLATLGLAWLALGRLVRPLSELAAHIDALDPEAPAKAVPLIASASAEQVVITEALNHYLTRNDAFVQRERDFIHSASHELRTPIAVIVGAAEVAKEQPALSPAVQAQLQRIQRTAHDVEELIALLLVLARDPARLAGISEPVHVERMLPDIIEDHRHLCEGKDLRITLQTAADVIVMAPPTIVQAAIGNLLRNAIENSDQGEIRMCLEAPGVVVIEDPGHGMSPEQISAIYARMARRSSSHRGGIGLELIARLCEHLGWTLHMASASKQGTRATLDMSKSARDWQALD